MLTYGCAAAGVYAVTHVSISLANIKNSSSYSISNEVISVIQLSIPEIFAFKCVFIIQYKLIWLTIWRLILTDIYIE